MTRKNTKKLIEYVKEGVVDCKKLVKDLLWCLSEAEVTEFMETYGYDFEEDDEDDGEVEEE